MAVVFARLADSPSQVRTGHLVGETKCTGCGKRQNVDLEELLIGHRI